MNPHKSVTHEQALRKTFSGHRFILSPVGLFTIVAVVLFLVGSIVSLTLEECSQGSVWLGIIYPIVTLASGVIVALLYASALLGVAQKFPNVWVQVNISLCTLIAILTIVISILLLSNCSTSGTVSKIPGILGIVGALLLTIVAATLFITWRSTEDDVIDDTDGPIERHPKRISVTI